MSTRVLGLVRASHPEPAAAVTVVAALLAAGVGHSAAGVVLVALTVLASQLAVGWSNDLIDAERDAAVGRTDKPVTTGEVARPTLARATAVAAVAVPVLALAGGPAAAACATLGLVSALLYNRPLKSTPVSVLPYAVSFGALPAFVVLALPGSPVPPAWLVAAAALLGAGAHFANVLPDLADDARTGCAACRTGSGRWAAGWPPPGCCSRPPSRWSSARPGRRRGPACRRSPPPSPCRRSAGTRDARQPDARRPPSGRSWWWRSSMWCCW